jgi:REP element-mobilizing transposase RayT
MGHAPRIPVWLHWEQSVIYFVTICVKDRKQVLANESAFAAFKNAAVKLREWRVLAAILMPDHLHAVVAPPRAQRAAWQFLWWTETMDAGRTQRGLAVAARVFRSFITSR